MKNSELINFSIAVSLKKKRNSPLLPTIRVYFNEEYVPDNQTLSYNKIFRFDFSRDCTFQKHRLNIIGTNNTEIRMIELKMNKLIINNFNNDLITYKELVQSKHYRFEFESPYSYYFVNKWID